MTRPVFVAVALMAALGIAASSFLAWDDVRQRAIIAEAWDVSGPALADGFRLGGSGLARLVHGDQIMAAFKGSMTQRRCASHVGHFTPGENQFSAPIRPRAAAYFVRGDDASAKPSYGHCYLLELQSAPWREPTGEIFLPGSADAGK